MALLQARKGGWEGGGQGAGGWSLTGGAPVAGTLMADHLGSLQSPSPQKSPKLHLNRCKQSEELIK